jgi:hypothetical protein
MKLFGRNKDIFPIILPDGSTMNLSKNALMPEEFIHESFVIESPGDFRSDISKTWIRDMTESIILYGKIRDFIDLLGELLSEDEIICYGPLTFSSPANKLFRIKSIALLSQDAVFFTWETQVYMIRTNMLVLPVVEAVRVGETNQLALNVTVGRSICRRSPVAETFSMSEFLIEPTVSDNPKNNLYALTTFFSLRNFFQRAL